MLIRIHFCVKYNCLLIFSTQRNIILSGCYTLIKEMERGEKRRGKTDFNARTSIDSVRKKIPNKKNSEILCVRTEDYGYATNFFFHLYYFCCSSTSKTNHNCSHKVIIFCVGYKWKYRSQQNHSTHAVPHNMKWLFNGQCTGVSVFFVRLNSNWYSEVKDLQRTVSILFSLAVCVRARSHFCSFVDYLV